MLKAVCTASAEEGDKAFGLLPSSPVVVMRRVLNSTTPSYFQLSSVDNWLFCVDILLVVTRLIVQGWACRGKLHFQVACLTLSLILVPILCAITHTYIHIALPGHHTLPMHRTTAAASGIVARGVRRWSWGGGGGVVELEGKCHAKSRMHCKCRRGGQSVWPPPFIPSGGNETSAQ